MTPLAVTVRRRLPAVSLYPLRRLLDDVGIIEHATYDRPDPHSGHCIDDAGRALTVACMVPSDPLAGELAGSCVGFLERMYLGSGRFRLRDVVREGVTASDDGSARAFHGLGVAVEHAPWKSVRTRARRLFEDIVAFESVHLRAIAHAVLGATSVVTERPPGLERFVDRMAVALDQPWSGRDWPWPETRLTYGNAVIPHAMLAIAARRGDGVMAERALHMLGWLLDLDTRDGHFSPTPVGGWSRGEPRPAFDQQPIEAWTTADACRLAVEFTDDARWGRGIELAAGWFAGDNDVGVAMWDPVTGRSYDGLERDGVNRNEGAESALALVATRLDLDWLECRPYRSRSSTR